MAFIHAHFYSDALGMQRTIDVILPQRATRNGDQAGERDRHIPVLYLLHGWSDDHTGWQRRTSIERYALEKGLAVIMPGTDLGFYTDMKYGYDFWQFFSKELPRLVHEFFPRLSTRREDTFVAGLSMGGFGALKLGINCPERFSAVASLSGLTDPLWAYRSDNKDNEGAWFNIFGDEDEMRGSVNDIHYKMEELIASGKTQPRFYQTCGTEDFLYNVNVAFRDRFKDRIDLTYHEEAGAHEWDYWDRNIQRVIKWLPLAANKEVC
ncbi:MAG: esterase family protein [Treponema sp.]|jgi:S-formylglutathione hydrolase FrmB|nr:esterase family protein [Treponema sp.]